jgi:hypothetical protein
MCSRYIAALFATILVACGGGSNEPGNGSGSSGDVAGSSTGSEAASSAGNGDEPVQQKVDVVDVTTTFFRSFTIGTYVFRSQTELGDAWALAPFKVYPVGIVLDEPAMPTYDFSKYIVVGLSLGVGKWCFAPRINGAVSDGNNLVVHYFVPTTGTLACLRDGPLIAFALVPRVSGSVQFVEDPPPF